MVASAAPQRGTTDAESAPRAKPARARAKQAEPAPRAKPADARHDEPAVPLAAQAAQPTAPPELTGLMHAEPPPRAKPAGARHAKSAPQAMPAVAGHAEPTPRAKPAGARHAEPPLRAKPADAMHAEPAALQDFVQKSASILTRTSPGKGSLQFGDSNDNCRIAGKSGASFSKAPAGNAKLGRGAPKDLGSFDSRNDSNVPSRNPVSKESQAGMQADLDQNFSDSAFARTTSNDILTFSSKSANNTK